jgi:hypothetical protein
MSGEGTSHVALLRHATNLVPITTSEPSESERGNRACPRAAQVRGDAASEERRRYHHVGEVRGGASAAVVTFRSATTVAVSMKVQLCMNFALLRGCLCTRSVYVQDPMMEIPC